MAIISYIVAAIIIVIAGTVILYHIFNKAGEKGMMEDAALTLEQNIDDGYLGAPEDLQQFVGTEGVSLTVLRPAGKIKIGDEIIDAVSYNDYIEEGVKVKVIKYENAQLYVLKS